MESSPPPALRISMARKLAIGSGDFGLNLYWQFSTFFLLFFYTDVLHIGAAMAGTIYMAALIVDAVLDPVIGMLAERTRSRFGRYRPYLILGAVPLALIFMLNFVAPFSSPTHSLIFVCVMHVAFRVAYAVVSIPYAALFARVTRDSRERGDLAGIRIFMATCSTVGVAVFTSNVATRLASPQDAARGWVIVAICYGLLATLLLLLAAWGAHGLDGQDKQPPEARASLNKLRAMATNRALLVLLAVTTIGSFSGTFFGKNLLYYFKYVLHQEAAAGNAIGLGALVSALCVPVWTLVMRRIGKKNTWFAGALVTAMGLVAWRMVEGQGMLPHLAALCLFAVGSAAVVVSIWAMMPDTVEYGEWHSGVRVESLAFGVIVFGQKAALGLGAGALGLLLDRIGYLPNMAQSPDTLEQMKQLMLWVPLAGSVTTLGLMLWYPLGRGAHERITLEIGRRNAGPVSREGA